MPPSSQLLKVWAFLRRTCAETPTRLALFVGLALIAKWPLLSSAGALTDFRDAQYFTLFEESARIAVARFHEAPLWNPYYCGGIPALATPSARFASPTFLFTLLFGTLRADAVIAFFMTVVGLEGTFRYVRARGASSLGAVFAAPVFALSGIFASAPPLGWTNFFGFELIPWVAYGARRALAGSVRGLLIAAGALAWTVGHGGTYAAPLAIVFSVVDCLPLLPKLVRSPRRIPPLLGMGALLGLLALGLGAVRLWPIAELLRASPRVLGGTPGNAPDVIVTSLFGSSLTALGVGSFLVGAFAIPVALAGGWLGGAKRTVPLLCAAAFWLWLAAGYQPHPSIFGILRTVPPFTMLRYPERFLALFALTLAALAAIGVTQLERVMRSRPRFLYAVLAAATLLVLNASMQVNNDHVLANGRMLLPPPPVEFADFKQARGNRWLAAEYAPLGRGSLSCFDDYQVPQSKLLRGDLPSEEYVKDNQAGSVVRRAWSANHVELHTSLAHPARVYVNQNWHPGWRASVGTVGQEQGLLVVDMPAGEHDLTLRFRPTSAVGGGAASLVALAVLAWMVWRARRVDSVQGKVAWAALMGAAALPLLIGLGVRAWAGEPPPAPPELLAPSGDPIVASAPPESAQHLGAKLAGGIELEAASLRVDTLSAEERTLTLELDWRLTAHPDAAAGLGVFVHVVPSSGDTINVDHALISTVLAFEDAPLGVTLRDVSIPITLPKTTEPRTWKVYTGLWMARRDGKRVKVENAGDATLDDGRVLVGTFETP